MGNCNRAMCLFLALVLAGPALAQSPRWAPVPGAPEVLLDLRSVQLRGHEVQAWLKHLPGPLPTRNATLARFDCRARTFQVLGSIGYDGNGKPRTSEMLQGKPGPLPDSEAMGWIYDALCEGARSMP